MKRAQIYFPLQRRREPPDLGSAALCQRRQRQPGRRDALQRHLDEIIERGACIYPIHPVHPCSTSLPAAIRVFVAGSPILSILVQALPLVFLRESLCSS